MIQNLMLNVFLILCGMLFGAFLSQRFSPEKVVTKTETKTEYVFVEKADKASKKVTKIKTKADGSSEAKIIEENSESNYTESKDNEVLNTTIIEESAKLRLNGLVEVNDQFKYSGYNLGASYDWYIGHIKFNELNKYNGFAIGLSVQLP